MIFTAVVSAKGAGRAYPAMSKFDAESVPVATVSGCRSVGDEGLTSRTR